MRILFQNTYKDWGGGEKWIINIGRGLKAKGYHVVISGHPGSESEKNSLENDLTFFPFKAGPDIAFWKIPKIRRCLRENMIDVAVFIQTRDVKIGALAAKLEGTKLIFARLALGCLKKDRLYHKFVYTKYIDGILLNSHALRDLFMSYGWFSEEFVHVVYDGITLPDNLPKIDLHHEFELKSGSKVIVGTGRLVNQKRFDLLIKVAKLSKENSLNWVFLIAGKGRLENELKLLTKELKVEDFIKFIGFRKDILPIMKAADLFVLSSDSEGMSNALIEAMAVGKACVATDVFGVSELFQDGKFGLMVRKGDSREIFNAIKALFADTELKQNLENKAAELIKKTFSIEGMVEGVEQLFLEQLEQKTKL